MMVSLGDILKDGFRIIEDHERERLECGVVLDDYVVIEAFDGKKYLTKKNSDTYIEFSYTVSEIEDGRK